MAQVELGQEVCHFCGLRQSGQSLDINFDGLYRYNLKEQMFDKIDLSGVFPNGENTDSDLFMVFVDAADKVWITGGGGVVRCVYRNGKLSADGFWPVFIPISFSQDEAGRVWIGTLGEHIYIIRYRKSWTEV